MDVLKAIERRRSVRNYLNKEVEEDKLSLILEAARQAPSASNRQEWRFVIVGDKQTKAKLCRAAKNQKFVNRVIEMLALGYPAKEPSGPKNRLDLEEIVFFRKWGFPK